MIDLTIKTIPDIHLVCIKHPGTHADMGQSFEQLLGWMGERQLVNADTRYLRIFFADQDQAAENKLRSLVCATVSSPQAVEAPIETYTIAGGECAVLRVKGPFTKLAPAWNWLFEQWLPESGRERHTHPPFEEYLNNPQSTPPAELLTEIYLPLKPAA